MYPQNAKGANGEPRTSPRLRQKTTIRKCKMQNAKAALPYQGRMGVPVPGCTGQGLVLLSYIVIWPEA